MKTGKIVFLLFLSASAPLYADRLGAQTWLNTSLAQRLDNGLEFQWETEQRFSAERHFYQRYELTPQLIWHYSPRYDFSLGLEENRQWDETNRAVGGHEGFAGTTLKLPWRDWLLTSRQRFQFGRSDQDETSGVFRQRTELTYSAARLPFHLRPFVSDEWFFDLLNGAGVQENRAQAGLNYPINRAWNVTIYGLWLNQWNAAGNLTSTPVAGLNLNLNF